MFAFRIFWEILKNALMITVFVFVMMLLVDYFNVITQGRLSRIMKKGRFRQYVTTSFLGVTPGCLGAFLNVSFYIHGLISFGALVGGMIATSGDEAFVMLALFPKEALLLFGILFVLGIIMSGLSDKVARMLKIVPCKKCQLHEIHTTESCKCFDWEHLAGYYLRVSWRRAVLLLSLLIILLLLVSGYIGPGAWDWKKITMTILTVVTVVIIGSVPDHFLKDHIWGHIIRKHILRVFLWSFFALLVVDVGLSLWDMKEFIHGHMMWVLLIAVLLAIIPESGPHMIFVMMFAEGLVPFSVLLASSIVQDGHGMLPLLSHTLRDTLLIKGFNLVIGLVIGLILFLSGM